MAAGTVVNKAFCNHDRVKLWLAILSLYQNTSCFDTTEISSLVGELQRRDFICVTENKVSYTLPEP